MILMSEDSKTDDSQKREYAKRWSSPIARYTKDQRGVSFFTSPPSKIIQAQLSQMSCNTAIGAGRKSRSHAASFCNLQSLNFGWVNGARMMATGTGSGPCIYSPTHGINAKRPSSINFFDVSPTDSELRDRIGDYQPFLAKRDFRLKQKDVDQICDESSNQRSAQDISQTTLQDAGPEKEPGQRATDTTEPVIHVGPEGLGASHLPILSQLVINSPKVVH